MLNANEKAVFAVDGHVHVHDEVPDLHAIVQRISRLAPGATPVLMLADGPRGDGFRRMKRAAQERSNRATSHDITPLLIIPGWQVVSEEGLELLVQGVEQFETFGAPAQSVVEAAIAQGAIVTLPWGFGKWIGKRRRLVRRLLSLYGDRVLLGDISGRPPGWAEPLLAGRPVVRGADNLRLAGNERSIGRYGSLIECTANDQASEVCLMEKMRHPTDIFRSFGTRHGLARALMDQLRIRASSDMA